MTQRQVGLSIVAMRNSLLPILTLSLTLLRAGGAVAEGADLPPRSDGCCLHVDLENYADGFFAPLNAGDKPGTLLTRRLKIEPGKLFINADAEGGSIVAEIVDRVGRPLSPFTFDNCQGIAADSVRQPLTWRGATALPTFPVRVRFRVKNAELYAFWIGEDREEK